MNSITNTLRALVKRRLWPVALLLVAALVAVPMTLAKSPAPAPASPATAVAATSKNEPVAKPIVELSDSTAGTQRRRRVLGAAKDPFAPRPLPKPKKAKRKKASAAQATPTPTPTSTPSDSGSSAGGGSAAPVTPTATPSPTLTAPKGSVKVRFGSTDDTTEPQPQLLNHLGALPSADAPVLALEGLKANGKTAVFSIPGQVTAVGDGVCKPTPQDCETLELKAGETEFSTLKGAGANGGDLQYELDLMKIFAKTTAIPKDSVADPAATTPSG
jgi:hypothetical protein